MNANNRGFRLYSIGNVSKYTGGCKVIMDNKRLRWKRLSATKGGDLNEEDHKKEVSRMVKADT